MSKPNFRWLRSITHKDITLKYGGYHQFTKVISKPRIYARIGRDLYRDYPISLTILWGLRDYVEENEMLYNGEFRISYTGWPFSLYYYNNKERTRDEQA